jgi:2'-5' RNA ligase
MARLFVAVWPPEEVLDLVGALPRAVVPGVRWTTRDQWHVTLRFLGEAEVDDAVAALDRLEAAATEAVLGPQVGRLGTRVLVVPVAGLEDVAAAVTAVTADVGEPPEARRFHGHLTLARLRGAPACGLTDRVVTGRWPVRSVALVQSRLHPHGARYETVHEVVLRDP